MQPIQNNVQYKPGGSVFRYFIISRFTPIIIIFVVLGVILSYLEKAVASSVKFAQSLPFAASKIMSVGLPALLIIGILFLLYALISSWIEYIGVKFMFDEFAFHIQKGILSKSEIAIPYRQIQNVNREQSFNEKAWNIARVIVETAGTDDVRNAKSGGVLPILDANLATMLQQELLRRSSAK